MFLNTGATVNLPIVVGRTSTTRTVPGGTAHVEFDNGQVTFAGFGASVAHFEVTVDADSFDIELENAALNLSLLGSYEFDATLSLNAQGRFSTNFNVTSVATPGGLPFDFWTPTNSASSSTRPAQARPRPCACRI